MLFAYAVYSLQKINTYHFFLFGMLYLHNQVPQGQTILENLYFDSMQFILFYSLTLVFKCYKDDLRSFLCFALRILTAHDLLRHKRERARINVLLDSL